MLNLKYCYAKILPKTCCSNTYRCWQLYSFITPRLIILFFYLNKTTESQREPAINGNEKCRIGISKWHQNCKLATANQLSLALSLASLAVWQHLSQISRINTVPVPVPVPVPENWSSRH